MPKPRYNQNINLTIQTLGRHGEGVGYWHGLTIFIDDALPQEVIVARVTAKERKFGRAKVSRFVVSSPHRKTPICPLFGRCGGCQLMHVDDVGQLDMKQKKVIHAFSKHAALKSIEILPVVSSPKNLWYRNKIQFPIIENANGLRIGMYSRNSHDIVDVNHCFLHSELGEKAHEIIKKLLIESHISGYNPETQQGELRYLLIKTAVHTNQVLVTFVINGKMDEKYRELAKKCVEMCPEIKGVHLNINVSPDNTVIGDTFYTLFGQNEIQETILNLKVQLSAASFFQINPFQAEHVYTKALELANLTKEDIVLDAYTGIGTLALLAARKAKEVIGVECVPDAILDAKKNQEINEIGNVEFVCDLAENWIQTLDRVDVVFLNPPRKGCEVSLLDALGKIKPKKIVYISCEPETLAKDCAYLIEKGFCQTTVTPFDMFPQTAHVECVTLLELRKINE